MQEINNHEYGFYGWKGSAILPVHSAYQLVKNPRCLYDLLKLCWCAETCAPRMREKWTEESPTLGQCSVTAFLAQDIFGGEVRGIHLQDGGIHCFNAVGDCIFDLTSEQFGETKLDYEKYEIQHREAHFAKEEKRLRYELLKELLEKRLSMQEGATAGLDNMP